MTTADAGQIRVGVLLRVSPAASIGAMIIPPFKSFFASTAASELDPHVTMSVSFAGPGEVRNKRCPTFQTPHPSHTIAAQPHARRC